ncbi:NUDIX hydrolase [Metasolibacillus meyeri]|uniref:NUDIX hydrolase n=1 Tax=Metasolibacillus meyeri TaxID=1071052 RepID=UPI000D308C0D|nr:NUDIX domain-containing protein [Metasolibacillus meyeri]
MNDYIQTMRALIGHETLLTIGCGAIIEDIEGRLLLQKRIDNAMWGIPGGIMEMGETFEETVKREVLEETNLVLHDISLFGLYSGKSGFATYPNGDKVFSVQIIFQCKNYTGSIQLNNESKELCFFARHELPTNLNPTQAPFILDWQQGVTLPIIK